MFDKSRVNDVEYCIAKVNKSVNNLKYIDSVDIIKNIDLSVLEGAFKKGVCNKLDEYKKQAIYAILLSNGYSVEAIEPLIDVIEFSYHKTLIDTKSIDLCSEEFREKLITQVVETGDPEIIRLYGEKGYLKALDPEYVIHKIAATPKYSVYSTGDGELSRYLGDYDIDPKKEVEEFISCLDILPYLSDELKSDPYLIKTAIKAAFLTKVPLDFVLENVNNEILKDVNQMSDLLGDCPVIYDYLDQDTKQKVNVLKLAPYIKRSLFYLDYRIDNYVPNESFVVVEGLDGKKYITSPHLAAFIERRRKENDERFFTKCMDSVFIEAIKSFNKMENFEINKFIRLIDEKYKTTKEGIREIIETQNTQCLGAVGNDVWFTELLKLTNCDLLLELFIEDGSLFKNSSSIFIDRLFDYVDESNVADFYASYSENFKDNKDLMIKSFVKNPKDMAQRFGYIDPALYIDIALVNDEVLEYAKISEVDVKLIKMLIKSVRAGSKYIHSEEELQQMVDSLKSEFKNIRK